MEIGKGPGELSRVAEIWYCTKHVVMQIIWGYGCVKIRPMVTPKSNALDQRQMIQAHLFKVIAARLSSHGTGMETVS